jgi:hypothetical protein
MVNDTHIDNNAQKLEKQHAKLLTYGDRQALAFVQRGDAETLEIIIQLWVASEDHQLRVSIAFGSDDMTLAAFERLDQENLESVLATLEVPATLERLEAA